MYFIYYFLNCHLGLIGLEIFSNEVILYSLAETFLLAISESAINYHKVCFCTANK